MTASDSGDGQAGLAVRRHEGVEQASDFWRLGNALEAGKLICQDIPPSAQPKWATDVLAAVVQRTGLKTREVERVLEIGRQPSEWALAHRAFREIRSAVLQRVGSVNPTRDESVLLEELILAEVVAKVSYNATNPDDEFDEDSGWIIDEPLKQISDLLGDESFRAAIWDTVCSPLMSP
jgi:hypothetical protein